MMPHYATAHNPYGLPPPPQQPGQSAVKSEPVDTRYILTPMGMYNPPPLPGPVINGQRPVAPHPGGQTGVMSFPRPLQPQPLPPVARTYVPPAGTPIQAQQPPNQPAQPAPRIPQVDGPSESSGDEDSSPPSSQVFAPRTSHPSLPQPVASTSSAPQHDSEAINSDLDDSDTEGEEDAEDGTGGETDIVFCTYDKVARVKNKWKCTLKDGMIHINGRDYLFAKCTGEFEW
ncbi:transcription factor IIA, alpha/beta subunit-domain-containing protein [Collybia nuda]|uniref:Transcription factor IIA, alpha/beta subunit-domain-containing protein n=1 Tax=Collybia nuda TaxID=64659 RepID=A0A9P5Y794_9AGAR|nr:transcription factor IIA, alpha/beta subunit-domain-containing protein [Collybia nuda]